MAAWNITVTIICFLLAAFTGWKEYMRQNRARLVLRLGSVLLGVAAIACLALPISYQSKPGTGNRKALLLTDGFTTDSLSNYAGAQLYTLDEAIQKNNPSLKITLLNNAADVAKLNLPALHVAGYGFNKQQLQQLQHISIVFHPAKLTAGILSANWQKQIRPAQVLHIRGSFNNTTANTLNLVLRGLNTGLDSVRVPANSVSVFDVHTIPRHEGLAVYNLVALYGKDTIEKERIPFEIEAAKTVKVLMLASSPDFENRFLKNWLSLQGYPLAISTLISKNKFSREFYNMPQSAVDKLTPAMLNQFDLVIGDLSALKSLSPAETAALKEQIAAKGLGVIVKADSSGKAPSFLESNFPVDHLSDKNKKNWSLKIENQTDSTARLLLNAIYISPRAGTHALVTDRQNKPLVSSSIYGRGKIIFSVLDNTFNWMLAGNVNDYASLWSVLIEDASKKAGGTLKFDVNPAKPFVDNETELILNGYSQLPGGVKAGNNSLSFAEDEWLPYQWHAGYWPKTTGWQSVSVNGKNAFWWYAYQPGTWKTLIAAEKEALTKACMRSQTTNPTAYKAEGQALVTPVPKWYFYIILLLCCTFLWIEQKL